MRKNTNQNSEVFYVIQNSEGKYERGDGSTDDILKAFRFEKVSNAQDAITCPWNKCGFYIKQKYHKMYHEKGLDIRTKWRVVKVTHKVVVETITDDLG